MKRIIICIVALSFAISLSFGIIRAIAKDSKTDSERLAEQVTIRRDTYGIPHILAKTEESAAFALGYAQAEDHCLPIVRRLIAARGEAAKYLGQGQEGDFLMKRFDNLEVCKKNFGQLDPLMQKIYNAFAAGINHYVSKHRQGLPTWIPSFDGVDVLANGRSGAVNSAIDAATMRALKAKYPDAPQPTPSQPGRDLDESSGSFITDTESPGSNALALSGSRTVSGKPILLGNPHLNWSSLYWEAQVTVPGKINFFGSTLAGIPVLRAGFNEHLGWVTTNNNPDQEDIYALKLDPNKADHYFFEGQSLPLNKNEVTVEIKAADGSLKSEKRTYDESHLGPIIYRTKDLAFAYRAAQLESFRHFEGFYRLSKTRNIREWLGVIKLGLLNYSNFTYADRDGNILYQWNAHIPRRVDDGTSYQLDVPGDTTRYLWQGLHPMVDFPSLLNPSGGYIQNCNNPPWYTSLKDRIDPTKFRSYFERSELALRPQLALEMLERQSRFSLDDVKRMKFNTKMLIADRLKPDLIKAIRATPAPSDDLRKGLAVLESWDNTASADAKGAVLFQRFVDNYLRATKKPYAVEWNSQNPARTPSGISDTALAVKLFEEAVKWTRETFGSEAVAWGQVHRFRFKDVDLPADGIVGTYGAFRVVGFRAMPDGKQIAGWVSSNEPLQGFGDGWVIIVEFSKPVKAYSVLAYGQTANPDSKHSRDQIGLFANHELKPVWFTESEIKSNLESEYRP
ncbi:MAG TPA: penicillin acylase family protein [Blastocatellia bacterium]|nr:penicillin acylase family protein [Blastocatellia bacterium]